MTLNVLVTGGAGFIGSHVVDQLVDKGYRARILDNLSTGSLNNIKGHVKSGKIEFIEGDIRDVSAVEESLQGIDVVIHLAALVSVPLSIVNPDLTFEINVKGTMNLLHFSVKQSVKRFVFISSCSVYGDPNQLPVIEQTPPNPISPYAESKLSGERYCLGFSERGLLQSVVLRFFNVYGPRQTMNDYSGVITRFIDCCRQKLPLTIYGDGSQTRDFVNVKDTAAAILASAENKLNGEVFNIGSGKPISIDKLAKVVLELTDKNIEIRYENARLGDIKNSYADISKARTLLGYEPTVSLRDGLQYLIDRQPVAF
jgi:UDP-glucose 4-epimerase